MSESDTMFNEQDWRCAAVQLMPSTDPSYDNRTIASTLKKQLWIAMNNRDVSKVMKTKFLATVMVFGVVSSEGHIMLPHIFEVGLKVNTKVYLDVLKSVVNISILGPYTHTHAHTQSCPTHNPIPVHTHAHLLSHRIKLLYSVTWSTSSSPLLPGPLWPGMVVSVRISLLSQTDLFKNDSYSIRPCDKKNKLLSNNNTKKCKYEHTMNAIP